MSSRALLVVEGHGAEEKFFSPLKGKFNLNMEIVPYQGNISMLYDDMSQSDFYGNIPDLLKSRETDPVKLAILNSVFTDIYVVLDLDPQHSIKQGDGETQEQAIRRNFQRIARKAFAMASRMTNSTDPCLGQLYINYPSMESFRDMDNFFDIGYAERFISLPSLMKKFGGDGYKAIVGRRKMPKNPACYSADDYKRIVTSNVMKLSRIVDNEWREFCYADFRERSSQAGILLKQCKYVNQELSLGVLNTSSFLLIDYKGKPLYDSLFFPNATNETYGTIRA